MLKANLIAGILGLLILSGIMQSVIAQDEQYQTRLVEYKTEDGWTIKGTLRLPLGADKNNEYPAVLLLHDKEHDRKDFVGIGTNPGLAQRLPLNGFASLNIDWRGRGESMGEHQPLPLERHDFTTKTLNKMYLDVKAGLDFLADYPGIDAFRLGILASQFSAEHAVRAMKDTEIPVRALVLLGGSGLDQELKDYLATVNTPIYTAASVTDKPVFRDMVEVYTDAKNPDSYMLTARADGRGYHILFREMVRKDETTRIEHLIGWLGRQIKNLGRNRAIELKTRDGFTIHGNFRYPDDLGKNGDIVPGVIIAPGGRSNRYSYYRFEEEMSRRGIAVVSVEQRGRGQSMMGKTVEDPEIAKLWEEMPENSAASPYYLDVVAGIDFLVSQEGIDPNNIALLGGARGTRNATLAAAEEPERIKAMVLVSVYSADELRDIFSNMDASVLLIDTELNEPVDTLKAHNYLRNSELMIYPGLGHSHHIRYFDRPEMVKQIGDFFERVLFPEKNVYY